MSRRGYTSHGHPITGLVQDPENRPPLVRCGGPKICAKCAIDAANPPTMSGIRAVVEAVLEIHQPIPALNTNLAPARQRTEVCSGCGTDAGNWVVWPCPTVRAVLKAGGGAA